jgi:hypothetical protein
MYFKDLQGFLDERNSRFGVAGKTTLERRAEAGGDSRSYGDRHDYGEAGTAEVAATGRDDNLIQFKKCRAPAKANCLERARLGRIWHLSA